MKLKEFIKNLQEFAEQNPQALDFDVVHATDEREVFWRMGDSMPELCKYEGHGSTYFQKDIDDEPEEMGNLVFDSVCIN